MPLWRARGWQPSAVSLVALVSEMRAYFSQTPPLYTRAPGAVARPRPPAYVRRPGCR